MKHMNTILLLLLCGVVFAQSSYTTTLSKISHFIGLEENSTYTMSKFPQYGLLQADSGRYFIVMGFDLSGLPSDASIESASLQMQAPLSGPSAVWKIQYVISDFVAYDDADHLSLRYDKSNMNMWQAYQYTLYDNLHSSCTDIGTIVYTDSSTTPPPVDVTTQLSNAKSKSNRQLVFVLLFDSSPTPTTMVKINSPMGSTSAMVLTTTYSSSVEPPVTTVAPSVAPTTTAPTSTTTKSPGSPPASTSKPASPAPTLPGAPSVEPETQDPNADLTPNPTRSSSSRALASILLLITVALLM